MAGGSGEPGPASGEPGPGSRLSRPSRIPMRAARGKRSIPTGEKAAPAAPAPSPSRGPVRGGPAKRPAPGGRKAAVAAAPESKRARTVGGGGRSPLAPLSVGAAGRAAPQVAAAAAPRAGTPPAAQPTSKRPSWDLKGRVTDLRVALKDSRKVTAGLERRVQELLQHLEQREKELQDQQQQGALLTLRLGNVEKELRSVQDERDKWQREAQRLEEEKRRLEEEEEKRARALAEAEGRAKELGAVLQEREVQLQAEAAQAVQLRAEITAQKKQLEEQGDHLHELEMDRRRLHNIIQELKGNIRVFCRVRPVLPKEQKHQKGLEHLQFPPKDNTTLVLSRLDEKKPHLGRESRGDIRYDFSFDRVFPPASSQQEIFKEIALLVQSALDGYHVCIFAYGQTGSGKTYTMEGPEGGDTQSRGVIPRAVGQLFQGAQELAKKGWKYDFSASFLEIYNESLRDLLGSRGEGRGAELEIRRVSAASEELHVPNLRRVPVACEEEVLGLLQMAATNRSVAQTALNDRSSRSHSIFQLHIRGHHQARGLSCTSVLSLVDLAGSERLEKSLSQGERLRETQAINSSLSALGHVIMALSNKEPHIPYRNSKLTYLLQNSLGGSAKMLMIVNISPLEENFSETLNSLRFASKVNQCVVGTAHPNQK